MSTVRKRYKHWEQVMGHYESSGLNQKEYCEANAIDFKQFRYYRYRLNLASRLENKKANTPTFAPVRVGPLSNTVASKMRLLHPSGIECSFPLDVEESVLLRFLRGLTSC